MEFKKLFSRPILMPVVVVIFLIFFILWNVFSKAETTIQEEGEKTSQLKPVKETSQRSLIRDAPVQDTTKEDFIIQEQLDHDRQEREQTKYLKIKLEQTNLELDQEKALVEINKLRMENTGVFKDQSYNGQKSIPEVRVEYIGGDSVKKEAILSISGISFQVREKSNPTDSIRILSISDTGVTLHFSAPQEVTKTIDYKPE